MGFLSFSSKNKQDSSDDGDYVARDDENALAKSKRASSAGQSAERGGRERKGADSMLPEKKRARRRLVGAIALALAVAIGLPMILDSEPRPVPANIDIQIPSKDKAPPQPLPRAVTDAETLDAKEEIVDEVADGAPSAAEPAAPAVPAALTPPATPKAEAKAEAPPPAAKVEPKPEPKPVAKTEPKPTAKPEPKVAEKPADKPADKAPAKPKPADEKKPKADAPKEGDRALAILEGKADEDKPAKPQKFIVQVAALASQDKVDELQGKLRAAGIASYTRKASTDAGERIRVQIGPFNSKEDAEQARAKLKSIGMSGMMIAN